ncbi:DNA repair protein RecN [Hoylesella oralis ATCC 33269]|uniref:DNA repair protein RecN n=1 Tax=Hoylesella oralis ATCC 33269 TaxID=873533 RepID=E7RT66_9BACT|nr:DNA repair protein RecN [Hoylesella oralis]EFZ36417.1 DNA repair protein RecN [Hoylesella oralis ATCC 33269]EPH19808.1 DNA repair protein RecN [Hoylesella oralis HGA0225]SHF55121.1 DNA repair protein RecN (Recombination protein N) [Hoylesella oralis]
MLRQLYIRNFTLIDELAISFNPGFSVITGETGAGKSIILGAIGLLLGNRADMKAIKTGKERCVVEAHFDVSRYGMQLLFAENDIDYDDNDCIFRREINANGKSRAFINDTPVPLSVMREIGEMLVDVHSQHQNLLLNKEDFQLSVLDIIANDDKQKNDYTETYKDYHQACEQLEALKSNIERDRQNEDFLRFQFNELSAANLIDGEQEELEQDVETLSHAEDIKSALFEADHLFYSDDIGIVDNLKKVSSKLHDIANAFPRIGEIISRIDSSYIELKDVSQELSADIEDIDFDPKRLDEVNARLDLIYSLEKKYHVESIVELLEQQKEIETQLSLIDNSDDELRQKQLQVEKLHTLCLEKARILTDMRTSSAHKIEKEMLARLVPLGIPNVKFEVQITTKDLSVTGADKVAFMFSANANSPMHPISQVASGGEIARVMLSLKAMISGAVKLPTIIFDEIDTGVSGRVAEKMAQIMQEMGNHDRQVISITHLPQIAALGTTHYKVAKEDTPDGTASRMTVLDRQQRITEIAQMLSGSNVSAAAIENAKTLLKIKD